MNTRKHGKKTNLQKKKQQKNPNPKHLKQGFIPIKPPFNLLYQKVTEPVGTSQWLTKHYRC